MLNKAAILLFGYNPAITMRAKCSIKISSFQGTEARFSETPNLTEKPATIEGPLYQQIADCLNYLERLGKQRSPTLTGAGFETTYRYPRAVIQEAITNAVIHRDYATQNDIQVRVLDDRIEVENPGGLAGYVTVANIRRERFARNPIILRTLNRFSNAPNLDIGEGVNRMFEAMRQAGLPDPVYEAPVDRYTVKLTLYNATRDRIWDEVEQLLDKQGKITNQDVRQIIRTENSVYVTRRLREWVDKGLIVPRGTGRRDRHYVRPDAEAIPLF